MSLYQLLVPTYTIKEMRGYFLVNEQQSSTFKSLQQHKICSSNLRYLGRIRLMMEETRKKKDKY